MFDNGLLDEVKHLSDMGLVKDDVAMQGIGYKEVFDYLEGRCDEAGLREMIKQDTRHFAKDSLHGFGESRWLHGWIFPRYEEKMHFRICLNN